MPDSNKIQRDQATILSIIKYVLITALVIGIIYVSFKLFILLLPFLAGLVLARTSIALANRFHPMVNRLKRSKPGKPAGHNAQSTRSGPSGSLASAEDIAEEAKAPVALLNVKWAVAIYTILVIALIALIAGVIFVSITQLRELASFIPSFITTVDLSTVLVAPLKSLEGLLGGLLNDQTVKMIEQAIYDWQNGLVNAIPGLATTLVNSVGTFVGNLPAIFLAIIVILLSGYYFITDSANLYRFLDRSLNNSKFLEKSVNLFNILSKTLLRVIGGYMLLLIITFAMALIGLLIIKMPYAVILALVAAIIDFLPVLGLSATMIPISVYLFFNGNLWGGIGALIIWAVITVVRRFIEPPILGNALRLHPMATLFSMIVGVAAYGLGGILVGPVILVIAKEIMAEFGLDVKLRRISGELLNKAFD